MMKQCQKLSHNRLQINKLPKIANKVAPMSTSTTHTPGSVLKTIQNPQLTSRKPNKTEQHKKSESTGRNQSPKAEKTTKTTKNVVKRLANPVVATPPPTSDTESTATVPKKGLLKHKRYYSMHRVCIGQHVEIKRSDGRVHSAIVVGLSEPEQLVKVEWFEQGETKGKEVEFGTLLKINPTLKADEVTETTKTSKKLSSSPPANGTATATESPTKLHSHVSKEPREPAKKQHSSETERSNGTSKRTILGDTSYMDKTLPSVNKSPVTRPARNHTVEISKRSNLKENDEPVPSPVKKEPPARMASPPKATHEKIKELESKREERRVKHSEAKRQRHIQKETDKTNPHWQFLLMINEYRAQVDYRPLSASDAVAENRISVCVRKRPMDKKELGRKEIDLVTVPNKDHIVVHQPQTKVDLTKYIENQKFRFDYTFDEDSDNQMVYRFTAQPLVKTLFEGGYATCFAYGQTGSGKTHTMLGAFQGKAQDCSMGIYALTASDVFRQLHKPQFAKLTLKCSFFELYGGKVFDLLGKRAALRILEDGNKSVQVVGLSEVDVSSPDDVMELIKKGSAQRSAGTTSANANSSRSHAVFQMILRRGLKEEFYGKISLIDLAGNERGADTNNSDRQTRMEGAEINKSLLALKECIRSMSMNKNYVPFRLSKLTLVLRDSFVHDNTRTCMIAMVSPGMTCVENTLNTLRYADRVKELGSDEDGPSKPMADADFMIDPSLSDEEDLRLIKKSIKDEETMESTILLNRIINAQERTHDDYFHLQDVNDKLAALVNESQSRETDLEHYAKELIVQSDKCGKAAKVLQDSAKDLLQKLQKEQEQTKKRSKK